MNALSLPIIVLALLRPALAAKGAIIHPNCFFEPEFNEKYHDHMGGSQIRRIFRDSKKVMGAGAFGEVREVTWLDKGRERTLAVKLALINSREDEISLSHEIDILYQLTEEPSAVHISGCVETMMKRKEDRFNDKRAVYIITEPLYEDLDDRDGNNRLVSKMRRTYSNERRLGVYLKIAKAVQALHKKGIVHSDLKPGNIMASDAEFSEVKLVDFGFSNKVGEKIIGSTDLFAPPEYFTESRLLPSFDVYSFAITIGAIEGPAMNIARRVSHMWSKEMVIKRHLVILHIVNYHMMFGFKDKPKNLQGDHIVQIITDCLRPIASLRPTMDEVVERIEKILADKRMYSITPKEFKLQHVLEQYKILKEYIRKADHEDVKAFRDHPVAPVLNTKFGLQPEKNGRAVVRDFVELTGPHAVEKSESMFQDEFFASQMFEPEEQSWLSPGVILGAVVVAMLVGVACMVLL